MASDTSVGTVIEKVFAEFKKITPALIALLIVSGLILFLPESVLSRMALNDLPVLWKRICGIAFLVSAALIITITINVIFKKLINRRIQKNLRKRYIELPDELKDILLEMLRSNDKKIKLDYTAGTTQYLMEAGFIHKVQQYIFVGPGYIDPPDFVPQPWLLNLYNAEPELFQ